MVACWEIISTLEAFFKKKINNNYFLYTAVQSRWLLKVVKIKPNAIAVDLFQRFSLKQVLFFIEYLCCREILN